MSFLCKPLRNVVAAVHFYGEHFSITKIDYLSTPCGEIGIYLPIHKIGAQLPDCALYYKGDILIGKIATSITTISIFYCW